MKLYAFQPRGHGPLSFFVMAESEQDAVAAVEAWQKVPRDRGCGFAAVDDYESDGWGTEYYEVTEAGPGQVLINNND